jgi:hypothetical protein
MTNAKKKKPDALIRAENSFFCKANHTISNANGMVCLAKKKVINLKMARS